MIRVENHPIFRRHFGKTMRSVFRFRKRTADLTIDEDISKTEATSNTPTSLLLDHRPKLIFNPFNRIKFLPTTRSLKFDCRPKILSKHHIVSKIKINRTKINKKLYSKKYLKILLLNYTHNLLAIRMSNVYS